MPYVDPGPDLLCFLATNTTAKIIGTVTAMAFIRYGDSDRMDDMYPHSQTTSLPPRTYHIAPSAIVIIEAIIAITAAH